MSLLSNGRLREVFGIVCCFRCCINHCSFAMWGELLVTVEVEMEGGRGNTKGEVLVVQGIIRTISISMVKEFKRLNRAKSCF